nr:sulfatase-like hydrolase/transferase [Deltaproteobacteria bacterium]
MAESSTVRSWLAPSVVAACAGALAAGIVEGLATAHPVATTGLVALIGIPAGLVLGVASRALLAAWRPHELAARLTEEDRSMPRLAGWVVTIWLGALFLAWVTFQGTWLLAGWTAFKPLALGFLQPVIAVGAFLIVVALSRPLVAMIAAIARRIDARWRRRGWRTLLSSRAILAAATIGAVASVYLLWRFILRRRLVGFDTSVVHAPLIGAAVAWSVHLAWLRLGRARRWFGAVLGGIAVLAIGIAVVTVKTRPSVALEIWGARPIAGAAVAWFGLERIRDAVPIHELAPFPRLGATHPDIVLVTIETLRADQTPPYAGTADMPVLRELGKRGAVFAYAFSPSNDSERSLPSMLTGTAPNRITDDPRFVTLAEQLHGGGYETAGFVCCGLERRWLRGLEHVTIERDGA